VQESAAKLQRQKDLVGKSKQTAPVAASQTDPAAQEKPNLEAMTT
jgi:mitotic spindle assembly checkpoint protein MAD2B